MPIGGSPAAAARKAAARTMLRMLPPVSWNSRASAVEVDVRVARRARPGGRRSQMRAALGLVGEGELDDEVQPADEGLVQVPAQVGGQDGQPVVLPPSAAAGRRSRCWRSGRGRPAPRSACRRARRPRRRTGWRWRLGGRGKIRSRFFSVSPMYLLTTAERSILYRSSPSSPAMTSAAIVLPVPGGPANSALTPVAAARASARSPSRSSTRPRGATRSHSSRSCASGVGGQDDVVPAVAGLDLAGQRRELVARLGAGRGEQLPAVRRRASSVPATRSRAAVTAVATASSIRPGPSRKRSPSASRSVAGDGGAVRRQRLGPGAPSAAGRGPAERHGQQAQRRRAPMTSSPGRRQGDKSRRGRPAVRPAGGAAAPGPPPGARRRRPGAAGRRAADAVRNTASHGVRRRLVVPGQPGQVDGQDGHAGPGGQRLGGAVAARAARPLEVQPQRVPPVGVLDQRPQRDVGTVAGPRRGARPAGRSPRAARRVRPGRAGRRPPAGRRTRWWASSGGATARGSGCSADHPVAQRAPIPATTARRAASRSARVRASRSRTRSTVGRRRVTSSCR